MKMMTLLTSLVALTLVSCGSDNGTGSGQLASGCKLDAPVDIKIATFENAKEGEELVLHKVQFTKTPSFVKAADVNDIRVALYPSFIQTRDAAGAVKNTFNSPGYALRTSRRDLDIEFPRTFSIVNLKNSRGSHKSNDTEIFSYELLTNDDKEGISISYSMRGTEMLSLELGLTEKGVKETGCVKSAEVLSLLK